MVSIAFQMEPNLLADTRDHDELLFDDACEAATNNEESDMSEFSSNDADDGDVEKFLDADLMWLFLMAVKLLMMTLDRMVLMVMLRS